MRSLINAITGKNCRVSVYSRKRSVVAGTGTQGSLCALDDVRFLWAWFSRHAQAALGMLKQHLEPAAAGAMACPKPDGLGARPSRQCLGGPGSARPSGGL